PPRPELHGPVRPDDELRHVHRRRQPVAAAWRGDRDRPVGLRDRCLHPRRDADRLLPRHRLRQRGRPRRLRLPRLRHRRRRDDLAALLETAELVAGCRLLGRGVGRGRAGVVTVSTGEASLIADLAPRTGIDLPDVPAATRDRLLEALPTLGYIGNPLDPWGATDAATAYEAAFTAFAESGAYDVLAAVYAFPFRSLPSAVGTAL